MTTLKSQFSPEAIILSGAKIVQRNTFRRVENGKEIFRLHATDILTCDLKTGRQVLNSGGWRTVTTKARLNAYLHDGYYITQDKGIWYVGQRGSSVSIPFFDGMVLPFRPADLKKAEREKARQEKLRAKIKKFVASMPDPMPVPDDGDCFVCRAGGHSCLESHLKEGYLHGSLITAALRWAGVRGPEFYWQMGLRNQAKRALKRYLYRHLGLYA